jgi:hypothetical protein
MEEAKLTCPTCGSLFPAGARFCPKCGYVVPSTAPTGYAEPAPASVVYLPAESSSPWAPWIAALSLALLVGGGLALWSAGYFTREPSTTIVAANEPQTPPQVITQAPAPDVHITTPAPDPPKVIVTTPAQPPLVVRPPAEETPVKLPEIVSVVGRALETGPSNWRYGYTVKLRNTADVAKTVDMTISFLDTSGFVIDDVIVQDVVVPANSSKLYDGDAIIRAAVAGTIKTVKAEFR